MRAIALLFLVSLVACAPSTNLLDEKKHQADVSYKLAISHLMGNNPTAALKKLLRAVALDPENSSIHVALAQTYQIKRSYQNSERHYLRALELSDNDPRYLNNIASLYLDTQQWDKAIGYFDQASSDLLFLNPHVALSGKGYAYFQKKEYTAALQQYDEALAIEPGYATAYYLKSEVYQQMGNAQLQRKMLERAINLAPQYARANYQLGILSLAEKQTAAAIKHLQVVVEVAADTEIGLRSTELLQGLEGQ